MPQQDGEVKTIVATDKAPGAIGPYSQATIHGKTIYVSGCIGFVLGAEKPTLAEGGIEAQTRQCLDSASDAHASLQPLRADACKHSKLVERMKRREVVVT